ncbi:iron complex transport system substrate-binding protein [Paenibacillus endophyticus]|uniref:Iron complex transport system substrate-binding protein n=1 Tax=Paenibacillus endophyticus TaxID=1294268 RepID=A0A7W5GEC0_9BACL|nr:ABC transporter substrate-binding protein [Paenibacillus endophyticus]MBB3156308.1 iron complex transport system substrate-binding protein [Paenibacillus endophyticus]
MLMNRLIPLVALGLLLLTLAACGGNSEKQGQKETTAPAIEATAEPVAADLTRTVTHLKGESIVPAKIDRIVVLSAAYIDHLLTIGEKPAGVNVEVRYGGDYLPYLASELEGVKLVGSADSPNLEAIVEIDPDVILVESRTAEDTYEQLEKIAPTIVLGTEWLEYEDDTTYWTKDLLMVAELYDKVELAEQRIEELHLKTAKASEIVNKLDHKQLAYLRVREKNLQIYAGKGHPTNTLLYHDLGFARTELTPEEQRADLSLEVVPDLDADYIVLEVDPNGRDNLNSMNQSALWAKVPAVQNEKVYVTDSFWLFKGWGVIGRGQIVDDVLKMVE